MPKKACILAINMPDLEKWIQGENREGGLAKVPIWEELHVVDILQDPKDVIPSVENNNPEIVFISNRFNNIDSLKMMLERCKRSYPQVRIIVLLWNKTAEQIESAQEILHFCLHYEITTEIVFGKISVSSIKKALDAPIGREEAESYKDPNYDFKVTPASESESEPDQALPQKKSGFFDRIKPKLIPEDKPKEEKNKEISDVIPPSSDESVAADPNKSATSGNGVGVPTNEKLTPPHTQSGLPKKKNVPNSASEPQVKTKPLSVQEPAEIGKNESLPPSNPKPKEKETPASSTGEVPKNKLSDILKRKKNVVQLGEDVGKTARSEETTVEPPFIPPIAPSSSQVVPQFINAKVVTFYSPNSIGKTTILSNMAVQAAKLGLRPIAIDLNVLKHDLGAYFGIPRKTMGLEQIIHDGIDELSLKALINTKYGVDVVPIGMERARYDLGIEANQVNQILNIVARRMDYNIILVDTCNIIDEAATATILNQSDIVYLVVDQNRSFLEDIYNELIFAEEVMNLPRHKFRLIINNYVEKCDMTKNRIESYLKMKAVATIPSDRLGHLQAVNYGKPYCTLDTDDSSIWTNLVSNAIGRTLEERQGLFGKLGFGKVFSK